MVSKATRRAERAALMKSTDPAAALLAFSPWAFLLTWEMRITAHPRSLAMVAIPERMGRRVLIWLMLVSAPTKACQGSTTRSPAPTAPMASDRSPRRSVRS